jgi:hypothetical protein
MGGHYLVSQGKSRAYFWGRLGLALPLHKKIRLARRRRRGYHHVRR